MWPMDLVLGCAAWYMYASAFVGIGFECGIKPLNKKNSLFHLVLCCFVLYFFLARFCTQPHLIFALRQDFVQISGLVACGLVWAWSVFAFAFMHLQIQQLCTCELVLTASFLQVRLHSCSKCEPVSSCVVLCCFVLLSSWILYPAALDFCTSSRFCADLWACGLWLGLGLICICFCIYALADTAAVHLWTGFDGFVLASAASFLQQVRACFILCCVVLFCTSF